MKKLVKILVIVCILALSLPVVVSSAAGYGSPSPDQTRDQLQDRDQLRDQSCLLALNLMDQTKLQDQIQDRDRLKDQSCLLALNLMDQTKLQDQTQDRDRLKDQSCLLGQYQMDQTKLQDQTQDRDQLRDQSCLLTTDQEDQEDQIESTSSAINERERERARLQLREQLQLDDSAKLMLQERTRLQEQSRTNCFNDVGNHWAREQITSAYQWGFINGYQNGNFNPDGRITGLEGTLMVSRLMNCMANPDDTTDSAIEIDLDQVPEWAKEMLQERSASRIAAQSHLYGAEQLNRLQFAVMLAKALGLEPSEDTDGTAAFLDQSSIPASDLGYVNALRTLGVIEGSNGSFHPEQQVSRAEVASMLMRVVDMVE